MSERLRVGSLSELNEREPFCIEHRGVPYTLIKTKHGVRAFVSFCTHKDLAMFPPKLKKECLVCPHHKVAFEIGSGKVVDDRGKDVDDLQMVDVEVINDEVFLIAKKKHRAIVPKSERKWVKKEAVKMKGKDD
ncbi:MAG TPA: Rieske 2Fe-2S domain-containing protein [Blastocatellia bacterium]|nr:Rieske 2Fe-2S domain-containing protein [Blastocatellia bacterium]